MVVKGVLLTSLTIPKYGFKHVDHLLFVFVPHGGTDVDHGCGIRQKLLSLNVRRLRQVGEV